MAYEKDILDEFADMRKGPQYPTVEAAPGMVVEDRGSGFVGDVVRWNSEGVTLRDRNEYLRHFGWKKGGFLIEGRPVTLVRPKAAPVARTTPAASAAFCSSRTSRPADCAAAST